MATTTENLGMTLPDTTDPVDVTVLNGNFSAIDTFAGQQTAKDTEQDDRLTALETSDTAQDTTIAKLVDAGAKNLLKITGTSRTINGVTFTVNSDGTVTANGTNNSTSSATFVLMPYQEADKIPNGSYRLTGCPSVGSSTTYDLRWYLYSPGKSAYDTGNGAVVEKNGTATGSGGIAIVVKAGQTVDNVVFKPMLCTAEDHAASDAFVPYVPTMLELYQMIQALQTGGTT